MQLPSLVNTRTGSISPLCDDKLMGIGQNQRASLDVPAPVVRGFTSSAMADVQRVGHTPFPSQY